jgi:hypothetical protein
MCWTETIHILVQTIGQLGINWLGKILEILCSIRKLFVVGKYIYWKYGRLEISVYSYGNNMQ